jgi:hypothetical protein
LAERGHSAFAGGTGLLVGNIDQPGDATHQIGFIIVNHTVGKHNLPQDFNQLQLVVNAETGIYLLGELEQVIGRFKRFMGLCQKRFRLTRIQPEMRANQLLDKRLLMGVYLARCALSDNI